MSGANIMIEVHRQADENTKYHALYGYYFLNLSRKELSEIYCKSTATIGNWINQYESEGSVARKIALEKVYRKFGYEKRQFLIELYERRPVLYLCEAKEIFKSKFGISISVASIHAILHENGLTWKVLERRAIQIRLKDVLRFCDELSEIQWRWENLVFLDEASFDGRDMIRKRGYGAKGERILHRGEFSRSIRASILCFIGVGGVLNVYETEGTFDRAKFVGFLKRFSLDEHSRVKQYPGQHSIWILDGARIHCHENITFYLRSLGIIPIFLPAYCPMYNPIEFLFGMAKKKLQKLNQNEQKVDVGTILCKVFNSFLNYDMSEIFKNCGFLANGQFDPSNGLGNDLKKYGFGK